MDNDLLTIIIPTYNRKQYLEQCLACVCSQITPGVSVCVIDNHSNDYDFKSFIEPYEKKFGVVAIQNCVNIGLEGNILRSFEICKTSWIWILGDDDYILPNAISTVLRFIKAHPNTQFFKFNASQNLTTEGINELAESLSGLLDFSNLYFLSEGIHNVDKMKNYISGMYKKASTCIPQVLYLLDMCINAPQTRCVFTTEPLLHEHGQNISWNHTSQIWCFLTLFDIYRDYRILFKNNIFRNNSFVCWMYVLESDLTKSDKIYYYRQLVQKYGFYNFLRYTFPCVFIRHIRRMIPKSIKNIIKKLHISHESTLV